jgi:putative lipoic acid-binding regulatory protein
VPERNGQPPEARASAGPLEAVAELAFPTAFPIKILGRREQGFARGVLEVVRGHVPDFEPSTVEMRTSREGTYLSLTVTVNATSREQLDALYRDLCDHPGVVMVL